jgi:hypothetical protein
MALVVAMEHMEDEPKAVDTDGIPHYNQRVRWNPDLNEQPRQAM